MSTVPNDDSALVGDAEKYEQRAREFLSARHRGYQMHWEPVHFTVLSETLAALLSEVAREAREKGEVARKTLLLRAQEEEAGARELWGLLDAVLRNKYPHPIGAHLVGVPKHVIDRIEAAGTSTPMRALKDALDEAREEGYARGASAMRERAAEYARIACSELVRVDDIVAAIRALPLTGESAGAERQAEGPPEPRVGDVWMVPGTVADTHSSGFAALVVAGNLSTPIVSLDWLRANGRLLSRKGGA